MNEIVQRQEELVSMAEEVIAVLRETADVDSIHSIKQLQDTLRVQYERYQFEARTLLRKRNKELKLLQDEASEPHHAEFEASRADLEVQQIQLQDTIKELKQRIIDHEVSIKASHGELQQLKKQETDNLREKQEKQNLFSSLNELFLSISSIDWDLDSEDISGTFYGTQCTVPFNIPRENGNNVCNKFWKMIDDAQGFHW